MEHVETRSVRSAYGLIDAIRAERDLGAIGIIEGEPGTGKTHVATQIAKATDAVMVTAWSNITNKGLLAILVEEITGQHLSSVKSTEGRYLHALRRYARSNPADERWLVIDEINHLGWAHLETLRYCADELGCCVLLVGTELPDRPDSDKANLLGNQLASRVGGKRIRLAPMKAKEVAGYVMRPRFGESEKPVAESFMAATGGYWRNAIALANTCERLMKTQGETTLTTGIIRRASGVVGQRKVTE